MSHKPLHIYFAPFQGITTRAFRKVYASHFGGVDKLYMPYLSNFAPGSPLPKARLDALSALSENGIPVIPQILSKNAAEIVWLANECQRMGFTELNWNLGCPYPQVALKKRGSGLLPYPDMIDEILKKVMHDTNLPISIKCRLGYHDAAELNALVPVFNRYPLHEITIHARLGKQLYSGKPDQIQFGTVAQKLTAPVAYNGDVFTVSDFNRFRDNHPDIDRVMIGRGILYDPFLPARLKGKKPENDDSKALQHFIDDLYFELRHGKPDPSVCLNALKEYWSYLSFSFTDQQAVFRKIRKTTDTDTYEDAVKEVFSTHSLNNSANL